jgi:hypothetical protein
MYCSTRKLFFRKNSVDRACNLQVVGRPRYHLGALGGYSVD